MISYHLAPPDDPRRYGRGFQIAKTHDVERLVRGVLRYVWSPILWHEGRRHESAFLESQWCVLDFDSGELTLEAAVNQWCDVTGFIGTTKSHQKEKGGRVCDRFRVAMRWEKPITDLRVYRWNMAKIFDAYPCDKSCKDGARFFYPCAEVVHVCTDGYSLEVDEDVPADFEAPVDVAANRTFGIIPRRLYRWLLQPIPEGGRNTACYILGKELAKIGLSKDEIMGRIVASPTYNGKVSQELAQEIYSAVSNGFKAAMVGSQGDKHVGSTERTRTRQEREGDRDSDTP